MSLAKLIGEIASREELISILVAMEKEQIKLHSAIDWALGENGSFSPPATVANAKQGKYWWRAELRNRARG